MHVRNYIKKKYEKVVEEGLKMIEPVLGYKLLPAENSERGILVYDENFIEVFSDNDLKDTSHGTTIVGLALGTIGHNLEENVKKYIKDNEIFRAYALDAFGSAISIQFYIEFERICSRYAFQSGLSLGSLTMPGGENLELQRKIFRLLEADAIGMKINEKNLLIPSKSISIVSLIGKNMISKECDCKKCSKQNNCYLKTFKDILSNSSPAP